MMRMRVPRDRRSEGIEAERSGESQEERTSQGAHRTDDNQPTC
jgi:hypothetical protein